MPIVQRRMLKMGVAAPNAQLGTRPSRISTAEDVVGMLVMVEEMNGDKSGELCLRRANTHACNMH
jgi:hypothetical protein